MYGFLQNPNFFLIIFDVHLHNIFLTTYCKLLYPDSMDKYKEISPTDFDTVLAAFEDEPRQKAVFIVKTLFPLFTDSGKADHLMDGFNLEQYGYYRSIGLTTTDTAYALQMSVNKLLSLLNGEGLSFERFVELIKQELFSRAACKAKLLKDIREATGTKEWRTSLTLLEKLYPEEFGPKAAGIEERLERVEEKAWIVNIVEKSKDVD